jgi:flagellar motility protein MotE (MotC chaperone)
MSRAPRILPLLAVAIGGVLAMKAVGSLEGAPDFLKSAKAFAEEAAPAAKSAKAPKKGEAAGGEAKSAEDAATPAVGTAKAPPPICAPSAAQLAAEAGLSPAELRVIQQLQARRGEIDQRGKDIDTQLALLAAAEAKVDAKLKALTTLKGDVQGLLGQADAKGAEEVNRLVRVYSAMKPAEAAAVLVQLDDRVRIPVAALMKERALAAILAKMPPAEAKRLTEKLAQRYAPSDVLAAKAQAAGAAAPKPGAAKPAGAAPTAAL